MVGANYQTTATTNNESDSRVKPLSYKPEFTGPLRMWLFDGVGYHMWSDFLLVYFIFLCNISKGVGVFGDADGLFAPQA